MLEVYYKYRCKYQDYIIFIKSGSFYEVFDKDSMILNSIFYYKVKRFKDNIKTGFPINKLEHIIKLMGNINYIVVGNLSAFLIVTRIIKKEQLLHPQLFFFYYFNT